MNFDLLVWQVPTLGLTAQAFLLTVGLGSSSTPWARFLTGMLGLLTTAVSIQLMAKQRHHESWDSKWLETYERESGLAPVHARRPADRGLARHKSYDLWVATLVAFGAVALVSLVSGVLQIATDGRMGAWFSG
jgi:hypothetical protein